MIVNDLSQLSYIEQSSEIIGVIDKDLVYAYASPGLAQKIGGIKSLKGRTVHDYQCRAVEMASQWDVENQNTLNTQKKINACCIAEFADRNILNLNYKVSPIFDYQKNVLGLYLHVDILPNHSAVSEVVTKLNELSEQKPEVPKIVSTTYPGLSKRQSQCLLYILLGKTSKRIAEKLQLSPRTVEDYIDEIKGKFNCHKREDLIEEAHKRGFLEIMPLSDE